MIFLKKKHVIPKQGGGGGVPHLGKIPTFSRFFFFGNVPNQLLSKSTFWISFSSIFNVVGPLYICQKPPENARVSENKPIRKH